MRRFEERRMILRRLFLEVWRMIYISFKGKLMDLDMGTGFKDGKGSCVFDAVWRDSKSVALDNRAIPNQSRVAAATRGGASHRRRRKRQGEGNMKEMAAKGGRGAAAGGGGGGTGKGKGIGRGRDRGRWVGEEVRAGQREGAEGTGDEGGGGVEGEGDGAGAEAARDRGGVKGEGARKGKRRDRGQGARADSEEAEGGSEIGKRK
ncbi:uncharacterized protein LOC129297214 [Prosopis cineraria]|uniref:uncharacterized protein LOC129297214 n=1 Tax=Prosopis cineraria TaxID=364024 RepID=UPI0024108502|nr:uncharacterized protein LOC129297214 [Prosopis cineraria]